MRRTTSESGFTLVELMVASMITLTVIGLALTTFSNAMALNEATTQVADSNQNLRAGTNLLVRDLMQAGRNIPTGGISIPSGSGATAIRRPSPPGTSMDFDNLTWQTTLSAITTGAKRGPTIEGKETDLVTILMDDSLLGELTVEPSTASGSVAKLAADGSSLDVGPNLSWITGDPQGGIPALQKGDLIYFAAPDGTAIQTITNIQSPVISFETNDPFNLNQPSAEAGTITKIAGQKMSVRRVFMYTYFVHKDSSGTPRLMRQLNMFEPQALAGVIEDLTLSYDLVDGVTNPTNVRELQCAMSGGTCEPKTTYTSGDVIFGPSQIRKANLHVGVRAEDKSARQKDYIRNHLSTIIDLRNLAYVDRYK
jgi:type II secretory pathway pseudopilin PulG